MSFFLNLRLKTKLAVVLATVLISLIAVTIFNLNNQYQQMFDAKERQIESVIDGVFEQVVYLNKQVEEGKLTLAQAQDQAKALMTAYRFDNGNYIWVNSYEPRMVMHPIKAKLVGKDLSKVADPNGVFLFNEMVKVVKAGGKGYVPYYWSKPGKEKPVPKISYVKGFEPWGWIIGSGLYIDDIDSAIWDYAMQSLAMILFVVLLIATLFYLLNQSIVRPILMMSKSLHDVQNDGDISQQISIKQKDEVGDMVNQFNQHLSFLNDTFAEINRMVGHIAQGHFKHRIELDMQGDFLTLKSALNKSADQIDGTMRELQTVMHALSLGDFSVQISSNAEGDFGRIMQESQQAVNLLNMSIQQIITTMEGVTRGEYHHRIDTHVEGDLQLLTHAVNESLDSLQMAFSDLKSILEAQSKGDLSKTIEHEYQGELALLKNSVNSSAKNLNHIVGEIVEVSDTVDSTAHEVASGSGSLNERTQQMAASLEQTAASMEELTATVSQNTQTADSAYQAAQRAFTEAKQSSEVANKAVNAMQAITESSNKITDIMTLLDSITFQTNLLALNAAVEAARAGEHGKGFAVVAGEVRALAQKSADASREIRGLIETSAANVEQGSQYVTQTGESLNSIYESIKQVADMAMEISTASKEQASGIEQINHVVSDLDSVTQQNAALVEKTTDSAKHLNVQSHRLSQLMSFFQYNAAKDHKQDEPPKRLS